MGEVDKLRIALENFCSTKSDDSLVDDIPDDLEKILEQIALSGELPWQMQWKQIGFLVRRKILYCINEMNTAKKFTGSAEEYTDTMDLILSRVELFEDAPFTIQRLCELLLEPAKHYTSTDKYMRALLKNLLVVSGWRRQPESDLPDENEGSKDDSKIEIQQPDSTTESDQNSNVKSPPRARDDSMGSDSENQQPDSTTQEPKIEEKQEPKQEEPDNFIERPKSRNDDEEDNDVFDTMKNNSPKRKIALSTQKIQIQVGVGKGMPASEAEKMEEKDSKVNNEVSSSSETQESASESSAEAVKSDEAPSSTQETSKSEINETSTESERKRKRSSDSPSDVDSDNLSAPVPEDSTLTPQKLQKTE